MTDDGAADEQPRDAPHALVREVVAAYLDLVDAAAPGFVEGLYLVGSVSLGDFRPHESDLDFIAITAARPGAATLDALVRIHARLRERFPRPLFEGAYVTRNDLARDPARAAPAPSAHDGRVRSGDSGLDPVTWHTLARYGVPVRGPAVADLGVWTDRAALAAWTLDNLERYWRPWHRRFSRPLSVEGVVALGTWAPAWGVLGVSRLHYTLATGDIISKEGAGLYALRTFPPRRHRIIQECLRIRRGAGGPSLYRTPTARRRDALPYVAMAIEDAQRFRPTDLQR